MSDEIESNRRMIMIKPDKWQQMLADLKAQRAEIERLRQERDALLTACKAGNLSGMDGPQLLEASATIIENHTKTYFHAVSWLREKARLERAAIAQYRANNE